MKKFLLLLFLAMPLIFALVACSSESPAPNPLANFPTLNGDDGIKVWAFTINTENAKTAMGNNGINSPADFENKIYSGSYDWRETFFNDLDYYTKLKPAEYYDDFSTLAEFVKIASKNGMSNNEIIEILAQLDAYGNALLIWNDQMFATGPGQSPYDDSTNVLYIELVPNPLDNYPDLDSNESIKIWTFEIDTANALLAMIANNIFDATDFMNVVYYGDKATRKAFFDSLNSYTKLTGSAFIANGMEAKLGDFVSQALAQGMNEGDIEEMLYQYDAYENALLIWNDYMNFDNPMVSYYDDSTDVFYIEKK